MAEITDNTAQAEMQVEAQRQQVKRYQADKTRVSDLLGKYKGEIAKALPKLLTAERLIRTALTAMARNPDLLQCTNHSLISCILTTAQLGLLPDNILGEAYLIPFNNKKKRRKECQLIVGYKGLCMLAMRSGLVKSISAMPVFAANEKDGDVFDYDLGLNEKLVHKPSGLMESSRITHFYAIVRFINGGHIFLVMTRAQVEAVRDKSKNYQYSENKAGTVWAQYFDEMGCKTVVRRVMKYVPLSPEMSRAVALDEAAESGDQNTSVEFVDKMPEFSEDIEHEVLADNEAEKQEQGQQKVDDAKDKADAATRTAEELAKKTGSGRRTNPQ
jgi:recombination protein RecT